MLISAMGGGISRCPGRDLNTKHLLLNALKTRLRLSGATRLTAAAFTLLMMMMMMASFMCKTLTLFIICTALQDGCGLPLSERAEPPRHVRTKRCSCNSWDDKECIYFCHLDIIWVNTPSKLLPYGLGSPPSRRRRRSAERCECLNPADKTCSGFCYKSSEDPRSSNAAVPMGEPASNKLLASFRSVVKSNIAIAKDVVSSNERRLRSRTRR